MQCSKPAKMDLNICQVITDFKSWGGKNYRIEKNDPAEAAKFEELKAADREDDPKTRGAITMPEYLSYLVNSQNYSATDKDNDLADNIDVLMNTIDTKKEIEAKNHLDDINVKCCLPALVDALGQGKNTAYLIGKYGDSSCTILLIQVMNDTKIPEAYRCDAAYGLGLLEDINAIQFLISITKKELGRKVSEYAAFALLLIKGTLPQESDDAQKIMKALVDTHHNISDMYNADLYSRTFNDVNGNSKKPPYYPAK